MDHLAVQRHLDVQQNTGYYLQLTRERGSAAPLTYKGRRVATVLRTRTGVSPVYVSVGHRVSLGTAARWVLRCGGGYRLPETTRRAHLEVNALRASGKCP